MIIYYHLSTRAYECDEVILQTVFYKEREEKTRNDQIERYVVFCVLRLKYLL